MFTPAVRSVRRGHRPCSDAVVYYPPHGCVPSPLCVGTQRVEREKKHSPDSSRFPLEALQAGHHWRRAAGRRRTVLADGRLDDGCPRARGTWCWRTCTRSACVALVGPPLESGDPLAEELGVSGGCSSGRSPRSAAAAQERPTAGRCWTDSGGVQFGCCLQHSRLTPGVPLSPFPTDRQCQKSHVKHHCGDVIGDCGWSERFSVSSFASLRVLQSETVSKKFKKNVNAFRTPMFGTLITSCCPQCAVLMCSVSAVGGREKWKRKGECVYKFDVVCLHLFFCVNTQKEDEETFVSM